MKTRTKSKTQPNQFTDAVPVFEEETPLRLTQIVRADQAVTLVASMGVPKDYALISVLNDSQNDPPHGDSDGTISVATYNALRALERHVSQHAKLLNEAKRAVAMDLGLLQRGIPARAPSSTDDC